MQFTHFSTALSILTKNGIFLLLCFATKCCSKFFGLFWTLMSLHSGQRYPENLDFSVISTYSSLEDRSSAGNRHWSCKSRPTTFPGLMIYNIGSSSESCLLPLLKINDSPLLFIWHCLTTIIFVHMVPLSIILWKLLIVNFLIWTCPHFMRYLYNFSRQKYHRQHFQISV